MRYPQHARRDWRTQLSQNLTHRLPMYIGQTVMSSLKFERQLCMIDTKAMHNCRVQIVDVDRILGDVVRKIIGRTIRNTRLDSRPSKPHREASRMVIASIIFGCQLTLTVDSTPEFSTPDDKRVFQQTGPFEVLE